jgi:hypothetical protein
MKKVYFEQDGAFFYELVPEGQKGMVIQYKRERVSDYQISAAHRARRWFVDVWCLVNEVDPTFPG